MMTNTPKPASLRIHVEFAVKQYLASLDRDKQEATNLYEFFLHELEKPLLTTVLQHTRGNQSKTAKILGLNRGTLRSKLKNHGLL
ncbi:MAG: helix-turn-helix domain-containing protein [Moraxella sp.]|nr:helix-turn-helix domain-containing protein [Moraxella sp.]